MKTLTPVTAWRAMCALAVMVIVCALSLPAQAQPGASPYNQPPGPGYNPPPGPPPQYRPRPPAPTRPNYYPPRRVQSPRRGLTIGFGIGVGGMDSGNDLFQCAGCGKEDGFAAASLDFHVGGMITPRLALLFEVWGTGGVLDNNGDVILYQTMAMVAGQYWVTPKLWLKGGVGVSQLTLDRSDSFSETELDSGLGLMGAVGYEMIARGNFSMDLQLRFGAGIYDNLGPDGDEISAASIGLGFNWY